MDKEALKDKIIEAMKKLESVSCQALSPTKKWHCTKPKNHEGSHEAMVKVEWEKNKEYYKKVF